MAFAAAVAADLHERTKLLDGRAGAKPRISALRAESKQDGSVRYTITVRQNILPDNDDTTKGQIRQQHGNVESHLSSKDGILSILRSGGVR